MQHTAPGMRAVDMHGKGYARAFVRDWEAKRSTRASMMLTLTASGLSVGQAVPECRRRRFAQRIIDLVEEPGRRAGAKVRPLGVQRRRHADRDVLKDTVSHTRLFQNTASAVDGSVGGSHRMWRQHVRFSVRTT